MRAALRGAWQRFCSRCREGLRFGRARRLAACKRGGGWAAVLGVYRGNRVSCAAVDTELCGCFVRRRSKMGNQKERERPMPETGCVKGRLAFATIPKALGTRPRAPLMHNPNLGETSHARIVARRIRPG